MTDAGAVRWSAVIATGGGAVRWIAAIGAGGVVQWIAAIGAGGVVRWIAAIVTCGAMGCGAPPPAGPRVPPPIDAGDTGDAGDVGPTADAAPAPDPAMAEVLIFLEEQRVAQCVCADAACAEEVEALGFQWGFEHKALLDRARPTPAQDAAARAAIEATEACAERWHR